MRIAALLTCHNRRTRTLACLHALHACPLSPPHSVQAIVVDDGSSDGTAEAIKSDFPSTRVIPADGTLFWNRGMHRAFESAVQIGFDAYLWLNDDTILYPDALRRLIETSVEGSKAGPCIVVGTTRDPGSGEPSYGGEHRARWRRMRLLPVQPEARPVRCDTFNGNCVLITQSVVETIGLIDPLFEHAMGDTDYGLRATKAGIAIWLMPGFAGECPHDHPVTESYRDRSLPFVERWRRIMQPKGLPPRSWWHITRRHAGAAWPLYWAWPYLRLLADAPGALLSRVITSTAPARIRHEASTTSPRLGARIALATNVVAAYRVPELRKLSTRVAALAIFASSDRVEQNLANSQTDGLDLRMVPSFSWRQAARHPAGYVSESRFFFPVGLFRRLRAFAPDVVISMELGARTLICALYRRTMPSVRLVVHADLSERTEAGRGALRTLLRRLVLRCADAVIVNGRSGANYVRRLGVDPAKVFAVPYSSNTALFRIDERSRVRAGHRRLLYVGRVLPSKGLIPFCRALADWCKLQTEIQIEFVIVGDGVLRRPMAAEALPANLKFILPGAVAYESTPAFYREADIFVFPTLGDTWGLVVNEAMASGLPVLGSVHSQAVEELVEDGRTGWLFDPEREQQMTDALARALATPEHLLGEMGMNAHRRALAIDSEVVAEAILDVVTFAARGAGKAPQSSRSTQL